MTPRIFPFRNSDPRQQVVFGRSHGNPKEDGEEETKGGKRLTRCGYVQKAKHVEKKKESSKEE
jgi:hypothetical protein